MLTLPTTETALCNVGLSAVMTVFFKFAKISKIFTTKARTHKQSERNRGRIVIRHGSWGIRPHTGGQQTPYTNECDSP